jgi:hypothetical protein
VPAARTALARLRKLSLALPEAHEVEAWGEPTFRVKGKLFAMHASADTHHGSGREGVWIKSAHVTQDMLVRADPKRYFVPPYVGKSGWVGAYLDRGTDWEIVGDLLRDAYRLTASKKLVTQLDAPAPATSRAPAKSPATSKSRVTKKSPATKKSRATSKSAAPAKQRRNLRK